MLHAQFARLAAGLPATAGLRHDGVTHPYSALAERSLRIAAGLREEGIGPGTPVGLLLPNSPDCFAAAYALFALGAVAVPLSPLAGLAGLAELGRAARACRLAAIVARDDLVPRARELAAGLGGSVPVIAAGEGELSLQRLARTPPVTLPEVPGDAAALYLFSSGSTGRPKVVPHTHAEMLAEGLGVAAAEGLTPDDVVFNTLPANHGFGFMSAHFEAAFAGATTLYFADPRPMLIARDRVLATIAAERATVLPGVPAAFDALAAAATGDLSTLRLAFTGGIALRRPTYDAFRARFGIALGQAYGCTESGQVAFHPGGGETAWASVGLPQSNARIAIAPVPGSDGGEIVISGPSLTRGYLEADEAARASFRDGGFHTGDLGRIDADGRLYVTGRSKLIIEVGGHKVDPLEVEDVLAEHPAVAEAVVVGIPDGRTGGQRLKLFAVLRDSAGADDLVRFARERLAPQKVPALVELVESIPRSASGKVLRGRLIEGG